MKRIFSIIATLSMLTGCGYYFAPLDDLKLLHEDGVVAAGIYGDVGFIAVLREGEREGVSLCVEEEEQAFRARAYLVPVESDFLVVMSELEVWNDDRWAPSIEKRSIEGPSILSWQFQVRSNENRAILDIPVPFNFCVDRSAGCQLL